MMRLQRLWLSPFLPWLCFLAAVLIVAPWGNFPINDDWCYAWVAKAFAETGVFRVNVPVSPTLLGQTLLAWPVLKVFGYSHTALRLLTILLSSSYLFALSLSMDAIGIKPRVRQACVLVFAFTPLFGYFSTSFMTESYGYFISVWGMTYWFTAMRRHRLMMKNGGRLSPVLPARVCILTGIIIGSAFWIRQYCVLPYPALLGAGVLTHLIRRDKNIALGLLRNYGLGLLAFIVVVGSYFPWAQATGNYRSEFSGPLSDMATFTAAGWQIQPGAFIMYMTLFFLPLLGFVSWRGVAARPAVMTGLVILAVIMLAKGTLLQLGNHGDDVDAFLKAQFPFIGNVIYNGGIGPITLSDVYLLHSTHRPIWPKVSWQVIETLLFFATMLWIPLISVTVRLVKERGDAAQMQASLFGLLLAGGTIFTITQAHTVHIFDRYYFPAQIGVLFVVAVGLSRTQGFAVQRWRLIPVGATLLAMAFLMVAGLHDQFSWNEARWQLYRGLLDRGIKPLNIEAGYEVQGWMVYQQSVTGIAPDPKECINSCHCAVGWYCQDDSYRIVMNPSAQDGQEVVAEVKPTYWLARGPSLYATRRIKQ